MKGEATMSLEDIFGPPIHSYSRAQAVADGVLVDVSSVAREAGIRFPVALTRAVWEDCVAWEPTDSHCQTYQDERGRLWDVLWMLRAAIARSADGAQMSYQLLRVPRGGTGTKARLVTLKAICGPGDEGEPVITVMQPNED